MCIANPSERQTKPYPTDWKLCPHLWNRTTPKGIVYTVLFGTCLDGFGARASLRVARQTIFHSVRQIVGLASHHYIPTAFNVSVHTYHWTSNTAGIRQTCFPDSVVCHCSYSRSIDCMHYNSAWGFLFFAGLLRARHSHRRAQHEFCVACIRICDGTTENIYRSCATVFAPVWFETFECKHT